MHYTVARHAKEGRMSVSKRQVGRCTASLAGLLLAAVSCSETPSPPEAVPEAAVQPSVLVVVAS